ncbi:hypothetical protein QTO30_14510 [Yoonia sp. GPGPB17]|uniref:hypothetical protein n=1 Tax=Yoonia sp. GPGPB17 TaxID=3026147 RepID=UPI0030C549EA
MDATGDGLQNRTAWAGAGDAVLFYDINGDGKITEARQYIFTEWDPTAKSDFEALASVFDSNGDGFVDCLKSRPQYLRRQRYSFSPISIFSAVTCVFDQQLGLRV